MNLKELNILVNKVTPVHTRIECSTKGNYFWFAFSGNKKMNIVYYTDKEAFRMPESPVQSLLYKNYESLIKTYNKDLLLSVKKIGSDLYAYPINQVLRSK